MSATTPSCPRCGYDLSGQAATWNNPDSVVCPLTGTCSECGLNVDWSAAHDPLRTLRSWSFEHAPAAGPWRALRAAARALFPPLLWRGLRMEHPIRPARLIGLVASMLLLLHCVTAGTAAGLAYLGDPYATPAGIIPAATEALWPYARAALGSGPILPVAAYGLGLWTLLMCAAFLVLGDSFKLAKVRRAHLARALAYSTVGWILLVVVLTPIVMVAALESTYGYRPISLSSSFQQLIGPGQAFPALFGAWFLWFATFWWNVTHTYLRLRHGAAILFLLLLTSGLAMLVMLVLTDLVLSSGLAPM